MQNKLQLSAPPILTWTDLSRESKHRFTNLTFSDDCFNPLIGIPIEKSSVDQILKLFGILDEYATCFDNNGQRTQIGQELYEKFFTGGMNALFSDSSKREKDKFREKLMFPHPVKVGEKLSCPWHGKVKHRQLRIHFKRIKKTNKKIYIAYVGEKLTKQ